MNRQNAYTYKKEEEDDSYILVNKNIQSDFLLILLWTLCNESPGTYNIMGGPYNRQSNTDCWIYQTLKAHYAFVREPIILAPSILPHIS